MPKLEEQGLYICSKTGDESHFKEGLRMLLLYSVSIKLSTDAGMIVK